MAPHLQDGVIPPGAYRDAIKDIHTSVVRDTISKMKPNRVLGVRPPKVSVSEQCLPRRSRVVLAQLRTGFCARLNDYKYRIGASDCDNCPECLDLPASVAHLFECPQHPTNLSKTDLWTNPCEVLNFLHLWPDFSDLEAAPPQLRRRRRPPPEPPPPP